MSDPSSPTALVTGAAGVLGWPLSLALARGGRRVWMMVRRQGRRKARERLEALASQEPDVARRLRLVVGELGDPGVLDPDARPRVLEEADTILHCAGLVDPAAERGLAYRVHVDGTAAMLALAREVRDLRRFVHVSCTSVAGDHRGLWTEDMLLEGQGFAGPGAESKAVAERRVRASRLPYTIVRPSQLVAPELPSPNGLLHLLRLLLRLSTLPAPLRRLPLLPGEGRVDAVPLSWVVPALLALAASEETLGGTYHLNDPHAPTLGELLARVGPGLGLAARAVPLPEAWLRGAWRGPWMAPARSLADQALNLPSETVASLAPRAVVDPTRAERILRPVGLRAPSWEGWIEPAVEYARAHLV